MSRIDPEAIVIEVSLYGGPSADDHLYPLFVPDDLSSRTVTATGLPFLVNCSPSWLSPRNAAICCGDWAARSTDFTWPRSTPYSWVGTDCTVRSTEASSGMEAAFSAGT